MSPCLVRIANQLRQAVYHIKRETVKQSFLSALLELSGLTIAENTPGARIGVREAAPVPPNSHPNCNQMHMRTPC